ncbi:MAG: membrane protein insertase YidC [Spirochaetia bacterium]
MDKRTLLAVVLSVVVITVGFIIQTKFFMPPPEEIARTQQQAEQAEQTEQAEAARNGGQAESGAGGQSAETDQEAGTYDQASDQGETRAAETVATTASGIVPYGDEPNRQQVNLETELLAVTFDSQGAKATSIKLKKHLDQGQPLEMVQRATDEQGAFKISFGQPYDPEVDATFNVRRIDDNTVEFYREFAVRNSAGDLVPFMLKKRFIFKPNDYLFELRVTIENSVNEYPPLDFGGYAYTLSYGPQIGPDFEELDGRYEYRRYYSYADGSRDKHRLKDGEEQLTKRLSWAALLGKYFTVIGIPDATQYDVLFSQKPVEGMNQTSRLFFSRPLIKSSKNEDVFQFYVGPKLARELTNYNDPKENAFNTSGLHLEEVMDTGSILGWLEWILKKMLVLFHSIIPNWGVAIIMLTLAIKLILYPITHKSYESTSKMQALNPKISELREKYKDNPQKMNAEMASLYKTEGVNPLGGCLPLLLQMPIFIALYGLLNKHFDLRGATFIPGWINDLSSPETVFELPFTLPLLGWEAIHLLPILFAGTMFLSSKFMQTPTAGSNQSSMKMMTYGMPVFLFFVLYNAPSGLLVYWIMTNFLTMLQQKAIAKHQKKVKAEGETGRTGAGSGPPVKGGQRGGSATATKTAQSGSKTSQRGKGGGKKRKK